MMPHLSQNYGTAFKGRPLIYEQADLNSTS